MAMAQRKADEPGPGLDAEIAAYARMKPELEKHHNGKWVVIKDGKLAGAFDEFDTAARVAVERFGRGPYLIRQVGAPNVDIPVSAFYRHFEPA